MQVLDVVDRVYIAGLVIENSGNELFQFVFVELIPPEICTADLEGLYVFGDAGDDVFGQADGLVAVVRRAISRQYVKIRNHEIVALDIVDRQSLLTRFDYLDRMAGRNEHFLERRCHIVVVVYDQDFPLHNAHL